MHLHVHHGVTNLHASALVDWRQNGCENTAQGAFPWPSLCPSASARGHIPLSSCHASGVYKYLHEFSERKISKFRGLMLVCSQDLLQFSCILFLFLALDQNWRESESCILKVTIKYQSSSSSSYFLSLLATSIICLLSLYLLFYFHLPRLANFFIAWLTNY